VSDLGDRVVEIGRVGVRVAGPADTGVIAALRARWSGRPVTTVADARGYARLVLSPSPESVAFYRRAGLAVPDETARADRLLVRSRPG
jgi:hypothetical protein